MPTRYLKPGICDSSVIDKASALAECLYYRLLVNVDDFGRLDARPAVVRSKCFPLKDTISNKDTEKLLQELEDCGLIILYEIDGCIYMQFTKWDNVARSKVSKCPEYVCNPRTDVCNPRTVLPVTVTVTVTGTGTDKPEPEPELKPKTGTETKDLSAPLAQTVKNGTRLPADWVLPKTWGEFALAEKPSWTVDDVRRVADDFKDHWLANANQAKSKKADWFATWRKWVRSPFNKITSANVTQFQTASERRMAVTDKSIAEWLGDTNSGNTIEGECSNA